jgi:hypothetical protein
MSIEMIVNPAVRMSMGATAKVCCLCGKLATLEDPITREHAPPKQFYPKQLRDGLNLWVVPTHRSCNQQYQADEDYFYHALYPLVANASSPAAKAILNDLKRRAQKPQTPALLRSILKTARTTTDGGLLLPPNVVRLDVDRDRLRRVAVKIGRCLFHRDHERVMPLENCEDVQIFEREEDVPELYTLSWEMSKVNVNDDRFPTTPGGIVVVTDADAGQPLAESQQVFDYRAAYVEEERLHLYTLRFWEAFVFCMAFEEPV